MAKLRELALCLSQNLGLEYATVAQVARHAREGGFIQQGGRGTGAPDMHPLDCAHLLIAIMGAAYAKDSAAVIKTYSKLACVEHAPPLVRLPRELRALRGLRSNHTFVDALIAMIKAAGRRGFVPRDLILQDRKILRIPRLIVAIESPNPNALVALHMRELSRRGYWVETESVRLDYSPFSPRDDREFGDLQQVRQVGFRTFVALARLLNQ